MHKYFAPRMVRGLNDDEEEVFPINVRSGTQELTTQFQYETSCDFDESRNHSNISIRSHDIKNYSPDDNQREISCSREINDWGSPSIGCSNQNNDISDMKNYNFHEAVNNEECHFDTVVHNRASNDRDSRVRPRDDKLSIDEPVGSRLNAVGDVQVILRRECDQEKAFFRSAENRNAEDLQSLNQHSYINALHQSNAHNQATVSTTYPPSTYHDDRYLPPPLLHQFGNFEGQLHSVMGLGLQTFEEKKSMHQQRQQGIDDKMQPVQTVSDEAIIEAAPLLIEKFRRKFFCNEYRDMVKLFASKRKVREKQAATSLSNLRVDGGHQLSNFGGGGSEHNHRENTLIANKTLNLDDSEIEFYDTEDFFADPPDWCPKMLTQVSSYSLSKEEKIDSVEGLIAPLCDDENLERDDSKGDPIDIYFDAKEQIEERGVNIPNIKDKELDIQDPMATSEYCQKTGLTASVNAVLTDIDPSLSGSLPSAFQKNAPSVFASPVGAAESKKPVLVSETYRAAVARACLNFPMSLLSSVSNAMFGTANAPESTTLITGCQANALIPTAILELNQTVSSTSIPTGAHFLSPLQSVICLSSPDTLSEIGVSAVRLNTPVTSSATFLLPGALDSDSDSDADTNTKGDSDGSIDRAHCNGERDDGYFGVRDENIEQQSDNNLECLGRPALEKEMSPIEVTGLPTVPDEVDSVLFSNTDPLLSYTRNSALKRGSISSTNAVEVDSRVVVIDSVPQISSSPTPQIMINGRLINLGQNPFSSAAPNLLSCSGPWSRPLDDHYDDALQHEFSPCNSSNSTSNRLEEEAAATDSSRQHEEEIGKYKVVRGVSDDFSRFKYCPSKNSKLIEERTSSAIVDLPPLSSSKFKEGIRERKDISSALPSLLPSSSHLSSSSAPLYQDAKVEEIEYQAKEIASDKRKRIESNSRTFHEAGERCRKWCSDSESNADSDDDLPCAVCLEFDPWEGDPMVFCEGVCGMCVHIKCYGLIEAPQGDFFCESCIEGKRLRAAVALESKEGRSTRRRDKVGKKPRCILCKVSSGMMKRSSCGQWCHSLCVLFTGTSIFSSL